MFSKTTTALPPPLIKSRKQRTLQKEKQILGEAVTEGSDRLALCRMFLLVKYAYTYHSHK